MTAAAAPQRPVIEEERLVIEEERPVTEEADCGPHTMLSVWLSRKLSL
jgi:hypothetical protein